MTGVYECLCISQYAKDAPRGFCAGYHVFEHKEILTGLTIGIINNLAALLIQKCAEKIGFA